MNSFKYILFKQSIALLLTLIIIELRVWKKKTY